MAAAEDRAYDRGRIIGVRHSVVLALATLFPSVSAAPLDDVNDLEVLNKVMTAIAIARDAAEAQAVLDRL